MKRWIFLLTVCLSSVASAGVQAQPAVDGTLAGDEAFYGSALSIQNTRTQFGDASFGDPSNGGGGSEINQVFGTVQDGRLYVLVTGNLETNFNKLEFFIDSVEGGVNTLVGDELPRGVDGFCCGGLAPPRDNNTTNFGALQRMNGLTFDAGFDADFYLTTSQGLENADPGPQFWANSWHYADLTQGTDGKVARAGMVLHPQGMPNVQRATVEDGGFGLNLSDDPSFPDDPVIGFGTFTGPALPGLSQGELIDRNYALSDGGCTDDTGAGCIAPELPFALDVILSEYVDVDGDYALTGRADAADYTVWQDTRGSTNDLRADGDQSGDIGDGDYDFWVTNFGNETSNNEPNASNHRDFRNTVDLMAASDNSNTEGVLGSGGPDFTIDQTDPTDDNPEEVLTGIEFSIPLSEIGNPTGDIRLLAFVNGGGHDFASNQFSGVGILRSNLGGDGLNPETGGGFTGDLAGVNLANIDGDQFVTISQVVVSEGSAIPEPGSLLLVAMAMLCGAAAGGRRPVA